MCLRASGTAGAQDSRLTHVTQVSAPRARAPHHARRTTTAHTRTRTACTRDSLHNSPACRKRAPQLEPPARGASRFAPPTSRPPNKSPVRETKRTRHNHASLTNHDVLRMRLRAHCAVNSRNEAHARRIWPTATLYSPRDVSRLAPAARFAAYKHTTKITQSIAPHVELHIDGACACAVATSHENL